MGVINHLELGVELRTGVGFYNYPTYVHQASSNLAELLACHLWVRVRAMAMAASAVKMW